MGHPTFVADAGSRVINLPTRAATRPLGMTRVEGLFHEELTVEQLASVACSGLEHTGLERGGVALQRGQVVLVGSQAYVAVGAKGEECASFNPQAGRVGGLEVTYPVKAVGTRGEGYGGFKQGRIFYII